MAGVEAVVRLLNGRSVPKIVIGYRPPVVGSVRLFCLRHGESANVVAGAAGVLPAAPLTPLGREQASATAALLRDVPVDGVYASTARRATETAKIIAAAHGLRPSIMADLDEVGIGALEGATDPADPGTTAVVVGHVASLTAALATICHLGTEIWGAPLPYAVPFLVVRTSNGWQCPSWPARPGSTGQG